MRRLFALFGLLAFSAAFFAAVSCCHDNIIMRENNEKMRAELAEMKRDQERQRAEIRQIKTDAEIILRIAATGEFLEVE